MPTRAPEPMPHLIGYCAPALAGLQALCLFAFAAHVDRDKEVRPGIRDLERGEPPDASLFI